MSEAPFNVVDPIPGEDISGASGNDVIDAASKVRFTIKEAKVRRVETKATGEYHFTQLEPTFVIGPTGTDGEGKYKNKHFFGNQMKFPGLLLARNKDTKNSDWWVKQAPFQYKQFLIALGLPTAPSPTVDDEFLESLKGKEVIADIQLIPVEVKDEATGKYVKTDEKVNVITNFKKVE